jgi:hypothetical protein
LVSLGEALAERADSPRGPDHGQGEFELILLRQGPGFYAAIAQVAGEFGREAMQGQDALRLTSST